MPTGAGGESAYRYRILSAATPRMTAPDPFECQPGSDQGAMARNGLECIRRARGMKTALCRGAEEKMFCRGNEQAVKPYADD